MHSTSISDALAAAPTASELSALKSRIEARTATVAVVATLVILGCGERKNVRAAHDGDEACFLTFEKFLYDNLVACGNELFRFATSFGPGRARLRRERLERCETLVCPAGRKSGWFDPFNLLIEERHH